MVNSGAIATTSLLPGATPEDKWHFLSDGLSRFAGRSLSIADDVYRSASETNMRNRSIAFLLRARDRIYCDPLEALDLYTRQSSLECHCQGSRRDGCHARGWRCESDHGRARGSAPRRAGRRSR